MSSINMEAIIAKAEKCMQKSEIKSRAAQKVDESIRTGDVGRSGGVDAMTNMQMAAGKFINVVQDEVKSLGGGGSYSAGGLGATAVSAATNLSQGEPYKIDTNLYQIPIWFSGNLYRDSLAADEYDGIDNIVALLNNGYPKINTTYGIWLGHNGNMNMPSLSQRAGAHFIQSAVNAYEGNYSSEYGVVDIIVDPVYEQ